MDRIVEAKETKQALWDWAEHEVAGEAKALSSGHVWGQSALCRTPSIQASVKAHLGGAWLVTKAGSSLVPAAQSPCPREGSAPD